MSMNKILSSIRALPTGKIVELHNALMPSKPVKKFETREKGVSRLIGIAKVAGLEAVEKAMRKLSIEIAEPTPAEPTPAEPTPAEPKKARAKKDEGILGEVICPFCNGQKCVVLAGSPGTTAGDERLFCTSCKVEWWKATGRLFATRKPGRVAKAPRDPSQRAHSGVRVTIGADVHEFRSTWAAYVALNLEKPNHHQKFRKDLKAAGSLTHEPSGALFEILE